MQAKRLFRRWLFITCVLFLVCLLVIGAGVALFGSRFDLEQVEQIKAGMTLAEVEAILGSPTRTEGIVSQVGYQLGAPLIPDSFQSYVWEDWNHRVTVWISQRSGGVSSVFFHPIGAEEPFFARLRKRMKQVLGIA